MAGEFTDTIPDEEVTVDDVKSLLSSINAEMKEQGIKFRALVENHTMLQNQMLLLILEIAIIIALSRLMMTRQPTTSKSG
jgi:hypothetical protein